MSFKITKKVLLSRRTIYKDTEVAMYSILKMIIMSMNRLKCEKFSRPILMREEIHTKSTLNRKIIRGLKWSKNMISKNTPQRTITKKLKRDITWHSFKFRKWNSKEISKVLNLKISGMKTSTKKEKAFTVDLNSKKPLICQLPLRT